jgi:hypothetical protein
MTDESDPCDISASEVLERRRRGVMPDQPHDLETCGLFPILTCSRCLENWDGR